MRQLEAIEGSRERTLHEALAAGDEGAYHRFVSTHRPGMVRLAGRLVGDGEIAEEVVQDTFESVIKDVGKFRGEASLKTWTYRILVNRARRVGKRERRSVCFSDLTNPGDASHQSPIEDRRDLAASSTASAHARRATDPQSEVINRQRLEILAEGLRRLPTRQREIVVLRDVEGRESREVTELLEISAGNQRVLLHRGRAALRAALDSRDGGGTKHGGAQLWN